MFGVKGGRAQMIGGGDDRGYPGPRDCYGSISGRSKLPATLVPPRVRPAQTIMIRTLAERQRARHSLARRLDLSLSPGT